MFGRKPKPEKTPEELDAERVETAEYEALEKAEPSRYWFWVLVIAALGLAGRLAFFAKFGHEIVYEKTGALANTFAPGYGQLMHLIDSGSSSDPRLIAETLWVLQSGMIVLATLMVFALGRRVIFGPAELVPPILLNLSIAGVDLVGEVAPVIPAMFFLTTGVWLATVLRERPPADRSTTSVLLALGAGLSIGLSVLFSPAIAIAAVFIAWWSFRGLTREFAVLLLVAILILPASWYATHLTNSSGVTVSDATDWVSDNSVKDGPDALEHAYATGTTWNPRFARGAHASTDWNYEWIIPKATRQDTSYISSTRIAAGIFMVAYALLVVAGVASLFLELAGSEARLLAIPIVTVPLITLLTQEGNALRILILPFLAISLTLGGILATEAIRRGKPVGRPDMDKDSKFRPTGQ